MKVRVFVRAASAPVDAPVYSGTDHTFPGLPSVGQSVRFTDHRAGDFTVTSVGYVQDGDGFVPALWLMPSDTRPVYYERVDATAPAEYLDLNHDVPPDSMTTY